MTRRFAFVPVLATLTVACASPGTRVGSGDADVITIEEMEAVEELNAYEAVQRLRPQWLTTRGPMSFTAGEGVRLYVGGVLSGYAADLRSIRASTVGHMRYLSGREATARYGTDHGDGAILVELR